MGAAQLAAALKAEKLILMTDVPGVLKDKDDISTKYAELDIRTTRELVRPLAQPRGSSSHVSGHAKLTCWTMRPCFSATRDDRALANDCCLRTFYAREQSSVRKLDVETLLKLAWVRRWTRVSLPAA